MKNFQGKTIQELEQISSQIRARTIEMSYRSRAPHLGSALSCVDILTVLYWGGMNISKENVTSETRDRFIMSKGHAIASLYAALSFKDIIDPSTLEDFCARGSNLEEHPGPYSPDGVEAATGSLGHGLSIGAGMALAGKMNNKNYHVFVLSSDGECNEGSVWEAAMFASARNLNRLSVIVDFNKWQATGRSYEILKIEPFCEKWKAFGWDAVEVDGHDIKALGKAVESAKQSTSRPTAIVAHTVKGKGVSFMEDDNNWHYRLPSAQEVVDAKKELGIE